MKKRITARVLAILLLLCMLLPQFAACKKQNEDTSNDETQEEEGTQTVIEVPEDFKFKTAAGFLVEGNLMSMNYTHEDPVLDLSKRISVTLGAKWCLTSDADGTNDLTAQSINLSDGENVFYIKVTFRGESFVYKAVVNYRSAYTVEFYSNCNASVATQYVDKGATVSPPVTPVREGYTFTGWYLDGKLYDFTTAPTESMTLIAHWQKNDNKSISYDKTAPTYEGINAALHIVWKDYANPNGTRPDAVTCVLTQTYGSTTNTYNITLTQYSVAWSDSGNVPSSGELTQGEGGDWTLSLEGLPKTVNSSACSYTLKQAPLDGLYTTLQSGTEVINSLYDYVPVVDETAKLTTRNSRLYDAAGNMIVFKGVVTYNIGLQALDKSVTPAALKKLADTGCNAIRVSAQLIGANGTGYVWHSNGSARTGDYSDANGDERTTQEEKNKMISKIDEVIAMATDAGLYVIIDWAILSSNPYQYVNEASEFFGILAATHSDNPYVLFEICNEPGNCGWATNSSQGKGVKAYAEAIIDVIRQYSDAIIIVSPRGGAYYVAENSGDDPINDPLDDDRRYNVAYTFHNYPYVNSYGVSSSHTNSRDGFGWRLLEAYKAGITIVATEMSPMDATFDIRDTLGYDMEQMAMFVRLFQELDISFFYFRYGHTSSYNEWLMLKPNVSPELGMWNRDDLTECGKWYYDLITGDGVFITDVDYNSTRVPVEKEKFADTHSAYGLGNVFPTFALSGTQKGTTAYYFKVSDSDTLTDIQYKTYCELILSQVSQKSPKQTNGSAFTTANIPSKKTTAMELTYQHGGVTYTITVSYGENQADQSFGITFDVK